MRKMCKKNIKKLQKNQGVSGVQGLSFITFLAVVMVALVVAMLKSNLEKIPKLYPILPGWLTCGCSYGQFSSHPGEIPAKSSEIPPRRVNSLST